MNNDLLVLLTVRDKNSNGIRVQSEHTIALVATEHELSGAKNLADIVHIYAETQSLRTFRFLAVY